VRARPREREHTRSHTHVQNQPRTFAHNPSYTPTASGRTQAQFHGLNGAAACSTPEWRSRNVVPRLSSTREHRRFERAATFSPSRASVSCVPVLTVVLTGRGPKLAREGPARSGRDASLSLFLSLSPLSLSLSLTLSLSHSLSPPLSLSLSLSLTHSVIHFLSLTFSLSLFLSLSLSRTLSSRSRDHESRSNDMQLREFGARAAARNR